VEEELTAEGVPHAGQQDAHQADGRPAPEAFLDGLPAVRAVRRDADLYSLSVTEPHVALPPLLARLREGGHELASLTTRHASLEDVFVTLTGRHLRDGAAAA
jgi:ABC-2 type transport system ATP-binding protein